MRHTGQRRPEQILRAGFDGGGRQDRRAMVRRQFARCRGEEANLGTATKLPEYARYPPTGTTSRDSLFRIIVRARSTASGRRRPICITARSPRLTICCGRKKTGPKTFCIGHRQFDPVRVGLANSTWPTSASNPQRNLRVGHLPLRHIGNSATATAGIHSKPKIDGNKYPGGRRRP